MSDFAITLSDFETCIFNMRVSKSDKLITPAEMRPTLTNKVHVNASYLLSFDDNLPDSKTRAKRLTKI